MTTQEAIDNLRLMMNIKPEEEKTIRKAIEALEIYDEYQRLKELNTPKEPTSLKECPVCHTSVYELGDGGYISFNHCSNCGQAIEWQEEAE